MNADLAEIAAQAPALLAATALVFLRVGAAVALLPVVGERSVPQMVRLGLAIAMTLVIAPATGALLPPAEPAGLPPFAALAAELAAGLVIGLALRLFVHALQMAGMIIAQATSLSQIFGNAVTEPQAAIGAILTLAGLALAVTIGVHVDFVRLLLLSYSAMPSGILPDPAMLANHVVALVAAAFVLAVKISAPFIAASLLYNLAIGAINRAMPLLMVSLVGAPALAAIGIILLAALAPIMLNEWLRDLAAAMLAPARIWP